MNAQQPAPRRVRGRVLLLYLLLSSVPPTLLVVWLWPEWFDGPMPLPDAIWGVLQYPLLLVMLQRPLRRSGATMREILGPWPDAAARRWAWVGAVALVGLSLATIYALHLPLSYVAPDFVEWALIEDVPLIWTRDATRLSVTLLNVAMLIVLAPLVEELLFRGLLLPSWTARWNARRAVVLSSLCFALLHVDPIGAFVFAGVAALARIRTGALWLPILLHAANNALVVVYSLVEALAGAEPWTLAEFRADWWMGLAGLAVAALLLPGVLRRLAALPVAAADTGS